jgi:pimeloyl-ACP methyl ester carboxylesterase
MALQRTAAMLGMATMALLPPVPAASAPLRARAAGEIVQLPISFRVRSLNRSAVMCQSSSRLYTVRGHLVAPLSALRRAHPAVTVYTHSAGQNADTIWRFRVVRGYDYALEQARAGHMSAVVDRLGYGASDIPNGKQTCIGTQADVLHQVVERLRRGSYEAGALGPVAFPKVALAGHGIGGLIAQVEAYSFRDVDALIVTGAAYDQVTQAETAQRALFGPSSRDAAECVHGGQPKRPGTIGGYVYVFWGRQHEAFFDADPAVVAAMEELQERDPCGDMPSLYATIAADRLWLATLRLPLLLVFGQRDPYFPPAAAYRQRRMFPPGGDRTLLTIPSTGHHVMLERSAPGFRAAVATWLRRHGL